MILDHYILYSYKVAISVIVAGFWIYFRTPDCYAMIPRESILSVLFVMAWVYLNYLDPLFLPIGLFILVAYSFRAKVGL
jgi:hypothetical protein